MKRSKSFNPTKRLSDADVKEIVNDIKRHGSVSFSGHAEERMLERNLTVQDILFILENGLLTNSEYNDRAGNWKYRFEGTDIEGVEGVVITAIVSSSSQVIITVC